MSVSAVLTSPDYEESVTYDLASAAGWRLAVEWLETVPGDRPATRAMVDGEVHDTEALAGELRDAVNRYPPTNAEVRHTMVGLLERLDGGSPVESMRVTN